MENNIISKPSRSATSKNNLVYLYPELAQQWDSDKNTIPPDQVLPGSHKKAWWICDKGHSWAAVIKSRASGRKCPYCAGKKVLQGFNDFAYIHPTIASEWNYKRNDLKPQEVMQNSGKKVWWKCDKGHEWETKINSRVSGGTGCPYCSGNKVIIGETDLKTCFPDLIKEWDFDKNDLSPTSYSYGSRKKVWWLCPKKNHSYKASIYHRSMNKSGCPICAGQKVLAGDNDIATLFPDLSKEWDTVKNLPLIPQDVAAKSTKKVWWKCENGHSWKAIISGRTGGSGCPRCCKKVSTMETEVADFVKSILPREVEMKTSDRSALRTHELDIYIPEFNIAIEFNGLYWHSEKVGRTKDKHITKWKLCADKGIQLIVVWEDDWMQRREIVESMIFHKLGVSQDRKVYARNTTPDFVDFATARDFLDEYHIQGSSKGSKYIGLYDQDSNLVAVSSWRKNKNTLYLDRYATSCVVVGGMGKLLKKGMSYARENGLEKIVTFSDNSASDGNLYKTLGFTFDGDLLPDYYYKVGMERKHKFNYRISRFEKDPTLKYIDGFTESQLAELNELDKVWDYGKKRWMIIL